MEAFEYQPLDLLEDPRAWSLHKLRSIRLVVLLPGDLASPLQGVLCHALLPEDYTPVQSPFAKRDRKGAEASPLIYEALSYTWGREVKTHSIQVKSGICVERNVEPLESIDQLVNPSLGSDRWREIGITANLNSALLHIRLKNRPRYLWVDAICIDQVNENEKTQQVRIMDRIYAQADRVVVWLGEASAPAPSDPPKAPAKNVKESGKLSDSDYALQILEDASLGLGLNRDEEAAGRAAVERLLERPWFKRCWVVQEVLMARKCIFLCGLSSMSWDDMGRGIRAIEPFPAEGGTEWANRDSDFNLPVLWMMKINLGITTIMQMPYLLGHLYTRFCGDPRDKIFSICNLVAAGPKVPIDYSQSTNEVYTEVVKRCVVHHPNLSIITRHHTGFDPDGPNELNLPSWVPDFSRSGGDGSLNWTCPTDWYYREMYFADGRFETEGVIDFEFFDPFTIDGVLMGQGVLVDRIASVTEPAPDESYASDAWIPHVRAWEPPAIFSRAKYPLTGESCLRAYWRTLVADKHDLKTRYQHLSDAYAQPARRDFCYLRFRGGAPPREAEDDDHDGDGDSGDRRSDSDGEGGAEASCSGRSESDGELDIEIHYSDSENDVEASHSGKGESSTSSGGGGGGGSDDDAEEASTDEDPLYRRFVAMLQRTTRGRRFAALDAGGMALVPRCAAAGDFVYVLLGGSVPFVLRREREADGEGEGEGEGVGEGKGAGRFRMIGLCYAHGVMDGEKIEELKEEEVYGEYLSIY